MCDDERSRQELIEELARLRLRVTELEKAGRQNVEIADALKQSEAKFRRLTERAVVGVYLIQDNKFAYANPKFANIFGYQVDEVVYKLGPADLVYSEDWPLVESNLRKRISGAVESINFRFRGIKKNGEIIHVEVYGSRTDYESRPAVIGSLMDITDRIRSKHDLGRELIKFQALYDLALAMTAERSLDENLALVVEKSKEVLEADKSFIALRNEADGDLYMHTLSGITTEEFKQIRVPFGGALGGSVAQSGQWRMVEDYLEETGPLFHDVARAEGLVNGIAVPVKIGGTNLGVLYVFNRTHTPFSRSDLDTLLLFGNLAAVEIQRRRAEESLRESQERFRKLYEESKRGQELYVSLLNSSADAIVIYDMDGRAQYVSPSFTNIFGWTLDEVYGKRIPFMPDSEREASMEIIFGLIREGTPCSAFNTRRVTKDGRLLNISISSSRYHDHEGNPAGILVILRDITDKKRAEEALRQSEEHFRTLAEVAPFGIVVISADQSTEYLNRKFTEIFGYTVEDVPNTETWFRAAFPNTILRRFASSAWHKQFVGTRTEDEFVSESVPRVFRVRCKDGTDKISSYRAVVLPDGRAIATFLDVTAETEAQREIIRAKNQWERTFNAVSDLIMILDGAHRIVRVNKALANRLGVSPEALTGMDCHTGSLHDKGAATLCPDVPLLEDGKEHSVEVYDQSLGGFFDLRISPLRYEEGAVFGSVHVARDITAFKSIEQARRLAVHHLSHELKTPLSIIKASVRNLADEDLSPEAKQVNTDRMRRGLDRLGEIQRIVQDIVEPRSYHPRPFDIQTAVEETVREARSRSGKRSVSLVTNVEPLETNLIAPEVFSEVLRTLIKNAVENTPDEGEVVISVSQERFGVLLTVEDHGIGITGRDKQFLFDAFHHTQETERYSTRKPYDFNAGGKGLELMRLKLLAQEGCYDISFESQRCRYIPSNSDVCPGRISRCPHGGDAEGCRQSGGTTFSVLFHGCAERVLGG